MNRLSASVNDLKTNDRQWQAFTTEGHCIVLAPPGSGKTKLLTTRMAFDLMNKIPEPYGAACVTLTIAAAEELRRRIEELGVPGRATVFIGTVHSFALNRIVVPFAALVGRPELAHASIANKAEEKAAFNSALNSVFPRRADDRDRPWGHRVNAPPGMIPYCSPIRQPEGAIVSAGYGTRC
ncbi:MAG: UvrD-helicase domain-containing protein [Acidobacteria bacterium]|nr:UvrD-helicase domain-containing protein [Acidobacteriota bacterium]